MSTAVFSTYPLGDNLEMAKLVSSGLPAVVLRQIASALGVHPSGLAPLVNINEKTVQRRLGANAKLKPAESERVARLMRVVARAVEVFADEASARQWLSQPLKALGGQTPLALVATEPGAREVEQLLGRLEHGVFA